MRLTGVHACVRGMQHNNTQVCSFSPVTVRGVSRCLCNPDYARTDTHGNCRVCGAGYYLDAAEWRADISAGFVETDSDNFPVALIGHRGDKRIPVLNVRLDSISVKESKIPGYVNIEFEIYASDITGTIPMVDYYTTEANPE